jgi:Flp pilus assembly pilin Flp
MNGWSRFFADVLHDERAQDLVEYGLAAVLIALGVAAATQGIATAIASTLTAIGNTLTAGI